MALLVYIFEVAGSLVKFWPYTAIVVCANIVLYLCGILGTISYHRIKRADAIVVATRA
jgi:hypothetical protein